MRTAGRAQGGTGGCAREGDRRPATNQKKHEELHERDSVATDADEDAAPDAAGGLALVCAISLFRR